MLTFVSVQPPVVCLAQFPPQGRPSVMISLTSIWSYFSLNPCLTRPKLKSFSLPFPSPPHLFSKPSLQPLDCTPWQEAPALDNPCLFGSLCRSWRCGWQFSLHKCWVKLLSKGRRQVTGSSSPCSHGHLGNGVAVWR